MQNSYRPKYVSMIVKTPIAPISINFNFQTHISPNLIIFRELYLKYFSFKMEETGKNEIIQIDTKALAGLDRKGPRGLLEAW